MSLLSITFLVVRLGSLCFGSKVITLWSERPNGEWNVAELGS